MVHLHEVRDTDTHYVIEPITMAISNPNEAKNKLMLGDHNAEIYTFEIPRVIEGHDMTLCNMVEVHFINVSADKANKSEDIYTVVDMAAAESDAETLVFSWQVSGSATMYAGSLNFRIKFACTDESGNYTYKKWTDVYKGIAVSDGFDNGAAVAEEYSDVLAQWSERIGAVEERFAFTSQGRSAKYQFTTPGWKRVLNIIRGTNGAVDIGCASGKYYRMVQCLAFDFTGFVKYPADTTASKPVIIKRYENIFGEDAAVNEHPFKVTKVRIGYPAEGTEFPETDGVTNYEVNPVNCYLDIYVDFDPENYKYKQVAFNMNYAGFAESHNCEAITEETDAVDTGIYGEELAYYEVDVDSMPQYITSDMSLPYLSNDNINSAYGVQMNSDGILTINPASDTIIKSASNNYRVITAKNVKYAVEVHTEVPFNELWLEVEALERKVAELESKIS